MKTKSILLLISLLAVFLISINAYQNEDLLKIKLNQAKNYERQKNFSKAEKMYQQLLSEFPHNFQVITKLCNLYLSQNEFNKLKILLSSEKEHLNQEFIALTKIDMYLKTGDLEKAEKEAKVLIDRNSNNHSIYKKIASLFTKNLYFGQAIAFYEKVREESRNPELYATEMALLYQYQMNYQMAIEEYLNMLDERSYNSVKYRMEKLNVDNEVIIAEIQERLKKSEKKILKALLGDFLLKNNDYDNAFEIFSELGSDALREFAESCEKVNLPHFAIKTYQAILENKPDIALQLSIYNKIGDLHFQQQDYESAYNSYQQVVLLFEKTSVRTSSNLIGRALSNLAKLELTLNSSPEKSREFILKAKKYATTLEDRTILSISLADSYLYTSEHKNAIETYDDILSNPNVPKNLQSQTKYKLFLAYIFSEQLVKSDSIFQDFLSHNEGSGYFNDIVSTKRFISQSSEVQQKELIAFLESINKSNVIDAEFHFNNLISKNEDADIEFIHVKLAEFYYSKLQYDKSLKIFLELSKSENAGIYAEYVQKKIGDCYFQLLKFDFATKSFKEYLINFPSGTFAPEVRLQLKGIKL